MSLRQGFTLLETMIAISMAAILVMLGTVSLSGLFTSSGTTETKQKLSIAGNRILKNLENGLTYQKITGMSDANGSYTRDDCLNNLLDGIEADNVSVKDLFGSTTYGLAGTDPDFYLASGSASISPTGFIVKDLLFTWKCSASKNDLLKISFTLYSGTTNQNFYTEINMYNSF